MKVNSSNPEKVFEESIRKHDERVNELNDIRMELKALKNVSIDDSFRASPRPGASGTTRIKVTCEIEHLSQFTAMLNEIQDSSSPMAKARATEDGNYRVEFEIPAPENVSLD